MKGATYTLLAKALLQGHSLHIHTQAPVVGLKTILVQKALLQGHCLHTYTKVPVVGLKTELESSTFCLIAYLVVGLMIELQHWPSSFSFLYLFGVASVNFYIGQTNLKYFMKTIQELVWLIDTCLLVFACVEILP